MSANKIIEYIKRPKKVWEFLVFRNIIHISDKRYIEMKYEYKFGKNINLENPQTFNAKLQWLKLYDSNPESTKMLVNYEVKKYISNMIGEEYIIPTLGIYNKFKEINFNGLPNQFVLKCTHDSGSTIICKDKKKLKQKEVRAKINKALKNNYYYNGREWPYKNVKPRIIVEKYMEDYTGFLIDYKIYAFNGKCDYVMICVDREKENEKTKFIYYDKEWNIKKELSDDGKKYGDNINLKKPKNLDKMFEIASKLSKDIPFVRVDFYEIDGKLYFGELTFFPSGGFDNKRTREMTKYLDDSLVINTKGGI